MTAIEASFPRQPCVIKGCRRTFRREGNCEMICGRHAKACPHERKLHKQAMRRYNKIWRLAQRRFKKDERGLLLVDEKWDRLLDAAYRQEKRRWEALKREAQMLQDMGMFERPKRAKAG